MLPRITEIRIICIHGQFLNVDKVYTNLKDHISMNTSCTRKMLASLTLALSLFSVGSNAALIDLGSSTLDDATNLEWLDLTETQGMSYNMAEASAFVTLDGYRHATTTEVNTLFLNAGFLTTNNVANFANDPAAALLLNLLGCTQFCGGNNPVDTGRGFADFNTTTTVRPFFRSGGLGGAAAVISLFSTNKDLIDASAGHYLVRAPVTNQVSAPSTVAMLGLGLIGFGFVRKMKSRK
jgi:hypothetical protein